MNSCLFQFPGISSVFCLFQGIPCSGSADGPGFGDPQESLALQDQILNDFFAQGLKGIHSCRQVHGTEILEKPSCACAVNENMEADGMCSKLPGHGLLIKTADCQPILFADRAGSRIMAIHAGWRGNRADFPGKAVKFFTHKYNLLPEDIFAVRGPSLCPKCAEFTNFESEWGDEFRDWFDPASRCMNLWDLTRAQLMAAGVPSAQIFGLDVCTAENTDKYYSYRKNRRCGRQGSLIWIREKV